MELGIANAAVHGQRLFSGVQRAIYYLAGSHELFLLVYVDDLPCIIKGAKEFDVAAVALLFMVVIGVPFSWRKCKDGTKVEWMGYGVDIEKGSVGIIHRRASWICRGIDETINAGSVSMRDFAAALGRLNFAMAGIDQLRHFLGLLYAWSAATGGHVRMTVPKEVIYVLLHVTHVAEWLEHAACSRCSPSPPQFTEFIQSRRG